MTKFNKTINSIRRVWLVLAILIVPITFFASTTQITYATIPTTGANAPPTTTGTADTCTSSSGCSCPTTASGGCYSQCTSGTGASGCVDCSSGYCSDPAADPNAKCDKQDCDIISKYVNPTINLLSLVFGLIVVISIILGGIQFTTSEGDPQKAAAAKGRISKAIFALFAYAFLYAFLQFIVPGGIFNS
jgi:hypothetical protein